MAGDYVPHELLLEVQPQMERTDVEEMLEQSGVGGRVIRDLGSDLFHVQIQVPVRAALDVLGNWNGVLRVRPNYRLYSTSAAPVEPTSEPYWSDQWGPVAVRLPEAWDLLTDSEEVVGVLDSGVAGTGTEPHGDLAANLWTDSSGAYGWDFVDEDGDVFTANSHGTEIAGVIGAVGDNEKGVAGSCWKCRMMVLRIVAKTEEGVDATNVGLVIAAIDYALDRGVRLVNASWGRHVKDFNEVDLLHEKIGDNEDELLVVASAGNEGTDNDEDPFYPGSFDLPNVLAVTGLASGDVFPSGSNSGVDSVDLAAPSYRIKTTTASGYGDGWATSIACAFGTGAAALLWERYPSWTPEQVRDRLVASARDVSGFDSHVKSGGVLDVRAALEVFWIVVAPCALPWWPIPCWHLLGPFPEIHEFRDLHLRAVIEASSETPAAPRREPAPGGE